MLRVVFRLTAIALLGASLPPAWAADPTGSIPTAPRFAPPRTGVLLATDFRRGTLEGWQPDREGVWTVENGALVGVLPDRKQARSFIYAGSEDWRNYAVDLDVLQTRGVDKGIAVRVQKGHGIGVDLRGPGYNDVTMHRQEWPMGRASVPNANGVWHHLRVEAMGSRYRVIVDGQVTIDKVDPHRSRPQGRIALAAYTGGNGQCTVYYDNVVVTALH